ncbi:MAG: type IV toxin-antitoxin system AbiEi family antitoxin domain-containing protein [Candidatus Eremiobacteraeota bacterium]|nr:type IV toxin-antitoxin system AbiEi family antitoxin domain-containing protein [Candidatus Eremiobacteraeota bacterium]
MSRVNTTLYDIALEHDGVFTAGEAREGGVSPHALLQAHRRGDVRRLSRGIYRLENYPVNDERAQLWEAVLWPTLRRGATAEFGVLSHLTALHLNYALLEYTPPKVHITIPSNLRVRRTPPSWLDVHIGAISERDVTNAIDGLPVTTLERTVFDCIAARVDRRLIDRVLDAAVAGAIPDALDAETVAKMRAALG